MLTPGLNRGGNVDNGFSIQNIVDAQPRSECGRKTTIVVAGPRSTTHRGDSSRARGAPLEGPFRYDGVVCVGVWVLSLSLSGGGYLSIFGIMARIWAKF